jgi:predicted ABC-type sugar transport system permease subunit
VSFSEPLTWISNGILYGVSTIVQVGVLVVIVRWFLRESGQWPDRAFVRQGWRELGVGVRP